MGDGFLLHRGVHDDALEFALFDGADFDCGVDGGAEQFFQAGLSQRGAKASDLRGITRGPGIKVFEACKVLPVDVLGKALHQFFIAEVKAVLEQCQGDHESGAQSGASGIAGFAAADSDNGASQVRRFFALFEGVHLVGKLRCDAGLHFFPRQSASQNRQWMAAVDHLIQAPPEEIIGH